MCAGAATLCCAQASAQEVRGVSRVLLDRRLNERTVLLTSIDEKRISYTDSAGLERSGEDIGEYLAVLSPVGEDHAMLAIHPASLIELTDGERFVGTLVGGGRESKADSILWEHAALGVMEFKLDEVKRIQFQGGPDSDAPAPPRRESSSDLVVLANGDRVEGFVDSITANVRMDVNGTQRELPVERVQEIVMAGGGIAPQPKAGLIAWLKDGSVIACRTLHSTRLGELVLSPRVMNAEEHPTEAPASQVSLRLDDLWALSLDPTGTVPLASLAMGKQTPSADRRWARGAIALDVGWAPLGLADIEFPGPMTVEWDLPAEATRLASEAELPRQMWTWGDCELVVLVQTAGGESELWRKRINAEAARARIAISLPDAGAPRKLRVRLEAGQYGAVQDRIVLRRPVLLIEKK